MTPAPLVSVIIPVYNAERTLAIALASLLCQSYENWEAIVVDDGSSDRSSEIATKLADSRFRIFKLDKNYGRPIARQKALEEASGEYLCMLDADDWYLSNKLSEQITVMSQYPELTVLSSGILIVDNSNQLIGAKRPKRISSSSVSIYPPLKHPRMLGIFHAPSMLKRDIASNYKFDHQLSLSQDFDFLLKILLENTYGTTPSAGYVYTEEASTTKDKVVGRFEASKCVFKKYFDSHFPQAQKEFLKAHIKSIVYKYLFNKNLVNWNIRKSIKKTTDSENHLFLDSKKRIDKKLDAFYIENT